MTASENDRIFHFEIPGSVLVGRKAEPIKLTAALQAVRPGFASALPASGEAAVGKTRRATEFPGLADGYCAKVLVLKADSVSRYAGPNGPLIPCYGFSKIQTRSQESRSRRLRPTVCFSASAISRYNQRARHRPTTPGTD